MSRTPGGRRSPDAWASPHDRARVRLAERMVEPLEPTEAAWLDVHLVDCAACREIGVAYQRERELLRAMRVIPPPRDLWARTSAALDAEGARAGRGRGRRRVRGKTASPIVALPRRSWAPVGALGTIAAVLVVGFLLGNMLISGPTATPGPIAQGPSATPNLVPTPITVAQPGDVAWVGVDTDGSIVLRQAPVSDVCPANAPEGCAPIDQNASDVVTLSVKPKSVHQSPTSGQMVVFGQGSGGTGLSMFVIDVPKAPAPTPTPNAPTAPPSATPTESAPTTPAPTNPSTSPAPGSPTPGVPASSSPLASVTSTPKASPTASIVPNVTPAPSAATLIAVASGVGVLNAETAAYSPDGAWFAFTARSLDGASGGSDIYLWHAGGAQAAAVTNDHRSVFAGWVGDRLIGSRAELPSAASGATAPAGAASSTASVSTDPTVVPSNPAELATTSFLVDPATLARTSIPTPAWRPLVDPTGRFVVYWEGTVSVDPTNGGWQTASGRLVIAAWSTLAGSAPAAGSSPSTDASPSVVPVSPSVSPSAPDASPGATGAPAGPSPTPRPQATPDATAAPDVPAAGTRSDAPSASPATSPSSPTPSVAAVAGLPDDIASASGVDWAVAWDETGTHLAVWVGDRSDRSFGRLDLLTIVATNGLPTVGPELVTDRPALPGISLADGHLAWATPPGTDALGSQLTIYAYSGKGGGISSGQGQPGSDTVIVVQH